MEEVLINLIWAVFLFISILGVTVFVYLSDKNTSITRQKRIDLLKENPDMRKLAEEGKI